MTAIRRQDAVTSRASILDAAERLFLQRGFAGTSLSEVAKASGVAKSLIHHHFGSKDRLWSAVKRTRFNAYHQRQVELLAGQPLTPELAQRSMRLYFEFLRDNPQVLRMMWWMLLEEPPKAGPDAEPHDNELVAELGRLGVEQIEALQSAGLVRPDVRPESILMAFMGMVHAAFTERWVLASRGMTAEHYAEEAWVLFSASVFLPVP